MAYYRERYVPNGWTRTSKETGAADDNSCWPDVETINFNLFDLTVEFETRFNESVKDNYENTILKFRLANNEIILTQHKGFSFKEKGCDREYTYEFKIIDYDTKSILFYKPNLQRVEIAKSTAESVLESDTIKQINENVEVIVPLDDEEDLDNPFDTEFEDI